MQETHLKISCHKSLLRSWVGQVFHSGFNCKARGTAILINKNTPGTLYNNQVTLASVYAPNLDNPDFIKLFSKLPDLNFYQLIMGGVVNTVLDRSSPKSALLSQSSKIINSFLELYGITDVWCILNPTSRVFPFFSYLHPYFFY